MVFLRKSFFSTNYNRQHHVIFSMESTMDNIRDISAERKAGADFLNR